MIEAAKLEKIKTIARVNRKWMWTDDVLLLIAEVESLRKTQGELNAALESSAMELGATKKVLEDRTGALLSEERAYDALLRNHTELSHLYDVLGKQVAEKHREGCFDLQPKEKRVCHNCRAQGVDTARCEADPYPGWSLCVLCWPTPAEPCVSCLILNGFREATEGGRGQLQDRPG